MNTCKQRQTQIERKWTRLEHERTREEHERTQVNTSGHEWNATKRD